MEEGIETGQICNREGCKGVIEEKDSDRGCSCHICPPCSYCVTAREYCPECDWDHQEEIDDIYFKQQTSITEEQKEKWKKEAEERNQRVIEFWKFYNSNQIAEEMNWTSQGHSNSSMKKIGWFPPSMEFEEFLSKIRGTFGGRFERLNREIGRFEYIAYTD